MAVMSIRLNEVDMKHIEKLARIKKKDKSTVARDLLGKGWILHWLQQYREGRASLGTVAKELDLAISEVIDLLTEFGVQSPLNYSDYLSGLGVL